VQLPGGLWIERGKTADYFDDVFHYAYKVWKRWKMFGLGNGSGWKNEREIDISLITIFEDAIQAHQDDRMKKASKKRGS